MDIAIKSFKKCRNLTYALLAIIVGLFVAMFKMGDVDLAGLLIIIALGIFAAFLITKEKPVYVCSGRIVDIYWNPLGITKKYRVHTEDEISETVYDSAYDYMLYLPPTVLMTGDKVNIVKIKNVFYVIKAEV